MTEQETALMDRIRGMHGVTCVSLWERSGYRRMYVVTRSRNGGARWNGGVGVNPLYVNLKTGGVFVGSYAGARTYTDLRGTVAGIREAVEDFNAARQ